MSHSSLRHTAYPPRVRFQLAARPVCFGGCAASASSKMGSQGEGFPAGAGGLPPDLELAKFERWSGSSACVVPTSGGAVPESWLQLITRADGTHYLGCLVCAGLPLGQRGSRDKPSFAQGNYKVRVGKTGVPRSQVSRRTFRVGSLPRLPRGAELCALRCSRASPRGMLPPSLFARHYFYRKTLEDHAGSVVHRRALAVCSAVLPPPRVEEGDAEPEPAAAAAIAPGEVDDAAIVGQQESPRRRSLARDAGPWDDGPARLAPILAARSPLC